jgi:hypothetical protein
MITILLMTNSNHLSSRGTNFVAMRHMFIFSVKIWRSVSDPSGACKLMDCLVMVFMD